MTSTYAVTAQFYDAVASGQRASVDREIEHCLRGLDTRGAPIVDIGAGTGFTTAAIARICPRTHILAIEPDPVMRAALMTRICSESSLREYVSILPEPLLSAPLPPVISAAVASASLVHFDPQQRREMWALLAGRLLPGGRVVIEVQCPVAQDVEERSIATATVGQVRYEALASARRLNDQQQLWRMCYVATFGGTEIARESTEYVCWTISPEQLLSEAAGFGFTGTESGNLVVLNAEPSGVSG